MVDKYSGFTYHPVAGWVYLISIIYIPHFLMSHNRIGKKYSRLGCKNIFEWCLQKRRETRTVANSEEPMISCSKPLQIRTGNYTHAIAHMCSIPLLLTMRPQNIGSLWVWVLENEGISHYDHNFIRAF